MPISSGHLKSIFLVIAFGLSVFLHAAEPQGSFSESFANLSAAEIERRLPSEHPGAYYLYAGRLWGEGHRDKAAFWFYVGQLRFRFHLRSNPTLDPSGDPALLGSLQQVLGEPINLYVGGDTDKWLQQIDAVLAWDAKTENGFTSKKDHAKEWEEIRGGLVKLREYVSSNREKIRAQREEQGIGEIGVVNGTYVEERIQKMPKDWPVLQSETTPAMIVGTYEARFDALLGPIFFFSDQYKVLRAKVYELIVTDPGYLIVVARNGSETLLTRKIPVREENGAVVFDEQRTAAECGLTQGGSKGRNILRLNAAGELVIQRESVTEGRNANQATPVRLSFTFWNRAKRIVPPTPINGQPSTE